MEKSKSRTERIREYRRNKHYRPDTKMRTMGIILAIIIAILFAVVVIAPIVINQDNTSVLITQLLV